MDNKKYYIIKVGNMYVYDVHYLKGLFEKITFTIDKNVAEFYTLPDIRVNELIDYINNIIGCNCTVEEVED